MSRRALITGATGFVGSHLAEHLLAAGWEVGGFDLRPTWPPGTPPLAVRLWTGDLLQPDGVGPALREFAPDVVFHLAAVAAPTRSAADPARAVEQTIGGTVRLCEAMKALAPRPALFITGSATVYGRVAAGDLPIRETHATRPISSYGAAKAAQELYAWQYRESDGFRVFVTRSFNAAGPRQSTDFFLARLCHEVARREAGLERDVPVRLGGLDGQRDFLDVRDMARAFAAIAETPAAEGQPVNVCSGEPVSLRAMAETVRSLARVPVTLEEDPSRVPVSQDAVVCGSVERLKVLTGFVPRIPLRETIGDVLEYQRRQVGAAPTR
jgi:GDP-4-dehydro-6-deoxy-D-mannose reductase